jgi:hypothetical protein
MLVGFRGLLACLAVVAFSCSKVHASIALGFEELAENDSIVHDHGQTYSRHGLILTATHPEPGNAERFSSVGQQSTIYAGSTALTHGTSGGLITLTATDATPFDLLSIDLAEMPPGASDPDGPFDSGPFDVTFTGTKLDSSTVSAILHVDSFLTLKTFTFATFQDVVKVEWSQGAGFNPSHGIGEPTHQFDNIVVRLGSSEVPEPTAILVWAALAAITFAERKARRYIA